MSKLEKEVDVENVRKFSEGDYVILDWGKIYVGVYAEVIEVEPEHMVFDLPYRVRLLHEGTYLWVEENNLDKVNVSKRPAKKGDRLLIVNTTDFRYDDGDVLVATTDEDNEVVRAELPSGYDTTVFSSEFLVIEEEEEATEFNVGDTVEAVRDVSWRGLGYEVVGFSFEGQGVVTVGSKAEIIDVQGDVLVTEITEINGEPINVDVGHQFRFMKDEVKIIDGPVQDTEDYDEAEHVEKPLFNEGDFVVAKHGDYRITNEKAVCRVKKIVNSREMEVTLVATVNETGNKWVGEEFNVEIEDFVKLENADPNEVEVEDVVFVRHEPYNEYLEKDGIHVIVFNDNDGSCSFAIKSDGYFEYLYNHQVFALPEQFQPEKDEEEAEEGEDFYFDTDVIDISDISPDIVKVTTTVKLNGKVIYSHTEEVPLQGDED